MTKSGLTRLLVGMASCCFLLAASLASGAERPAALEGYSDYASFEERLEKMKELPGVSVRSLAKTAGGRDVYLLTVGEEAENKPAILVLGSVQPSHLLGSELALRMVGQLAFEKATSFMGQSPPKEFWFDDVTLYFIPLPSPDASQKNFSLPAREQEGNARPTDDDRDGTTGEDPANDLNGDGAITMMRIEDPAGDYFPHPDDPRVMIRADRAKNERGRYRLLSEGQDEDGDEQWNEDASGGVVFPRNFTFQYPFFEAGAGPHQVSEPETRAIADFCFEHPNIALVYSFSEENNLWHPWKPDSQKPRIPTHVSSDDAPLYAYLAEQYQSIAPGKEPSAAVDGKGSFAEWAYFHYGRWSLSSRPWWIPPAEAPAEGEGDDKPKRSKETRGADELRALDWFAATNLDGFVDWTPVEHPDFPGRKVEVGGFKPFYRTTPPLENVTELAKRQTKFLERVAELLPRLTIERAEAESLGGGLHRITVRVLNDGYLPTSTEHGASSRLTSPLQVALDLPDDAKLLRGAKRQRTNRLASGEAKEFEWLARLPAETKQLTVRTWSPAVGEQQTTIELTPSE